MFAAVGLITATGAFTTVEAERTATVDVTGDADALLAIGESANIGGIGAVAETDQGEAEIDLSDDTLDEYGAAGLNPNANTTINPVINVTNQGTEEVELTIDVTGDGAVDDLHFVQSDDPENPVSSITLSPGTEVEFGLIIETGALSNGNDETANVDVVFEANA